MSNTAKLNNCPKCGMPIPAAAPQALCPKCVLLGAAQPTEGDVPATATSEIPSLERISAAFPQLEILELIGRGGMGFVFKARQPHLDRAGESMALSQAEAARKLETTEGAVKVMIHRLRKRFREVIRLEIGQTLHDSSQVDEELRHLIEALS